MVRDALSHRRRPWPRYLAATALYVLITLAFFAPVLGTLSTHLIGDGGDNLMFAWNAWWLGHAVETGQNPYFCPLQFAPTGIPLVLHTIDPLPSGLVALLAVWLGLPLAYNVVVLAQFPLAGLCGFALARAVTKDTAGALVAGVVFMLCPYFASKSTGHFNLQWAALLPLYTLCLLRGVQRPRGRWPWLLAAIHIALVLGNVHTLIFAANVAAWYFLYRGFRTRAWRLEALRFWRLLRPSLVISAAWAAFVGYYALRYHLRATPYHDPHWCPEPLSYILPLHVNSAWRSFVPLAEPWRAELGHLELAVYLGWLVLPAASAGWWLLRRRPWVRFMIVAFVAALVLSLGAKLQWHRDVLHLGPVPAYLPMRLYRYVPLLGVVGQTGRYLVIGYMALAVGSAALVTAMRRRWGWRAAWSAAVLLIAATCADYAFVPVVCELPSSPIPPGPGRVLDPRLGNPVALWYQTQHGRPLVGGYVARIPTAVRAAHAADPGVGWLFQRPKQRGTPPPAEALRAALHELDVRYICVAPDGPERQWLAECGLPLVAESARDAVFSVLP